MTLWDPGPPEWSGIVASVLEEHKRSTLGTTLSLTLVLVLGGKKGKKKNQRDDIFALDWLVGVGERKEGSLYTSHIG